MPEVREENVRAMRNGRMSQEMFWRRGEGIRSREQILARLDINSLRTSSEEIGLKQVRAIRGECRRKCFLDVHGS